MDRTFVSIGALFAFLAVAAGAIGAHLLEQRIAPDRLDTFELAVRYQMYHALALLFIAWATLHWPESAVPAAGWLFVGGIIIFSGTLYGLALGGPRWLGAVTPLGGLSFLAGWLVLGWTVARASS